MKISLSSLHFMRAGALVLSILLTSESPFAATSKEDCTPIDIRKDVGPIRDQGDIGWCYANAAADLLSFEYKHQLGGQQASAAYMALTFTDTFMADLPVIGKSFFDGGSAYFSIKAYQARHKSVCLQNVEDQVRTQGLKVLGKDGKLYDMSLSNKLKHLMLLKTTYDTYVKDIANHTNRVAFLNQWNLLKQNDSYLFSMGEARLKTLLANSSERDFPHDVADTLCESNSVPVKQNSVPDGKLVMRNEGKAEKAVKAIHQQLSRNNIVGLAYLASILTEPNLEADIKSAHLSVLVGRRWNGKQCEFLIRNSWGKGCAAYQKSHVFKPRCEGDGHVWIPESIMKRNMIGISYFDKNPSAFTRLKNGVAETITDALN